MNTTITAVESASERTARTALESHLLPGETLLALFQGKLSAGIWTSTVYDVGLTDRRLVVRRSGKGAQAFSIGLAFVRSLEQSGSRPVLTVRLNAPEEGAEKLSLIGSGKTWTARLRDMVERYQALGPAQHPSALTIQQAMEQAEDLHAIGLRKAALAVIQARTGANPAYLSEPGVEAFLRRVADELLGMRAGAVMFGLVLLAMLWLAVNGQAQVGFGIVLAGVATVDLLRGIPAARGTGLGLALLTAAFNIVLNVIEFSPVDIAAWVFFGLAMWLVLGKNTTRPRIALGGGVFLVGVVGLIVFIFVSATYFPDVLDAATAGSSQPFHDDFSKDQGWTQEYKSAYTAGRENEAYAVWINEANLEYVIFPPVLYFPENAEVDAWVPEEYVGPQMGLFGFVCRYQGDGEKFYAILFDQTYDEYAVFRVAGGDIAPLTGESWLPAGGLHVPGETDRVGVTCKEDEILVSINGRQQAPVTDPGMARFGRGKLGLMAVTFEEAPDLGFKVMFDNASFEPPK